MQIYYKSLIEVEEWKEKVYQDIKNLTSEECIEYFRKGADKFLSEHGIKLKQYRKRKSAKAKNVSNV